MTYLYSAVLDKSGWTSTGLSHGLAYPIAPLNLCCMLISSLSCCIPSGNSDRCRLQVQDYRFLDVRERFFFAITGAGTPRKLRPIRGVTLSDRVVLDYYTKSHL